MGVKTRKYVRHRTEYDATQFVQDVPEEEIPEGAPTHCSVCLDELTPLRRLAMRPFCTKSDCQEAGRRAKTANWRLVDMHKQGETVVIVGEEPISTSKRGI